MAWPRLGVRCTAGLQLQLQQLLQPTCQQRWGTSCSLTVITTVLQEPFYIDCISLYIAALKMRGLQTEMRRHDATCCAFVNEVLA
jgi:hypothetical protein